MIREKLLLWCKKQERYNSIKHNDGHDNKNDDDDDDDDDEAEK